MTIVSHFPVVSQAEARSMLRALALAPGQTVEGRVLGPGQGGATLVQIGRQAMSLTLPNALPVGSLLTLGVQQGEGHLRLALIDSRPPSSVAPQQLPATSVEISQRPAVPQGPLTYGPPAGVAGATPGAAAPLAGATGLAAGIAAPVAPSTAAPAPSAQAGGPIIAPPGAAVAPSGPALQRPGAAPYGMAGLGANPTGSPPGTVPAQGALPGPQAAALAQMVQQALPGQGSIGALTGMLAAAIGRAGLPEPVLKAARQILDNQLSTRDGKIDAGALKSALRSSGIFQEAMLAQGSPAAAGADTKSGLLAMRQGLAQWLGNQPQIAQISQIPPPLRHVLPRAKLPEVPLLDLPDEAEDLGRLLLERTEGALSRVRLHQHASLPEALRGGESQWNTDLPIALGQQQAVLQLQIHHDGGGDANRPEDRGWQVRFAVNLPDLGEVGAQVSLRGQTTGIMLWADRDETAKAFSDNLEELRASLESVGLKPGALVVRVGAPREMHAPAAAGHFVDAKR
ncbi:flagellar hook-length control protein FliK [Devosia sp.]|uniref:flagellar hook-length control protein FliK n=1 Tax=Devosia sp. TaxID=1871048 RepID=UPI001B21B1A1|nr:flagellar hook-length control protein FliK [Devosia sp.]MBO9587877.1 flagellar hook-length control protein FliK [Devosia sp.]